MPADRDPETGKFIPSKEHPIEEKPEVKADDVSYKEIHDKDVETIAAEGAIEKQAEAEKPVEKVEEKPIVKEEVKIEEKPVIDPEKLKNEIAEEVSQKTAEKITEALGGKKTTQIEKDKYQEYVEKFAAEKGRAPTWFEVAAFIKDEAKAELKAEQEQAKKAEEDQKKAVEESDNQRLKAFNDSIDEQLADLYKAGKLPVIKDKNNQNDPGVVARKALFKAMLDVNVERMRTGQKPIYSVKEIYYEHYKAPSTQPAGFDAPVSMGRSGSVAEDNSGEIDYLKDIHNNKSYLDMYRK